MNSCNVNNQVSQRQQKFEIAFKSLSADISTLYTVAVTSRHLTLAQRMRLIFVCECAR